MLSFELSRSENGRRLVPDRQACLQIYNYAFSHAQFTKACFAVIFIIPASFIKHGGVLVDYFDCCCSFF